MFCPANSSTLFGLTINLAVAAARSPEVQAAREITHLGSSTHIVLDYVVANFKFNWDAAFSKIGVVALVGRHVAECTNRNEFRIPCHRSVVLGHGLSTFTAKSSSSKAVG